MGNASDNAHIDLPAPQPVEIYDVKGTALFLCCPTMKDLLMIIGALCCARMEGYLRSDINAHKNPKGSH